MCHLAVNPYTTKRKETHFPSSVTYTVDKPKITRAPWLHPTPVPVRTEKEGWRRPGTLRNPREWNGMDFSESSESQSAGSSGPLTPEVRISLRGRSSLL